jgi:hypothetical protein
VLLDLAHADPLRGVGPRLPVRGQLLDGFADPVS